MQKVLVRQLKLGNQSVGCRFDLRDGDSRIVAVDVPKDIASSVLKMFNPSKIQFGPSINGVINNGVFVTSNEKAVMEASNLDAAEEILCRYYFGKIDSLDDKLELSYDESERIKKDKEYLKYLKTIVTGKRQTLNNIEFGEFCDVPHVYRTIVNSSNNIHCNIMIRENREIGQSNVYFGCLFTTLQDMLKFIYNVCRYLNRKEWVGTMCVKKDGAVNPSYISIRANATKSQEDFIRSVLLSLKIHDNFPVFAKDVGMSGSDGMGSYCVHKRELYLATYVAPIPAHNEVVTDKSKYRSKLSKSLIKG